MKKILTLVLSAFLLFTPSLTSAQIVFPTPPGVACPSAPGCVGPIITLPPGALPFSTRNLGAKTVVRSSKATFLGMEVYNGSGATAFIQIFNAQPGAISLGFTFPDFEFPCATLTFCTGQFYLPNGIAFINGITIASTTTEAGAILSAANVQAWVQFQ